MSIHYSFELLIPVYAKHWKSVQNTVSDGIREIPVSFTGIFLFYLYTVVLIFLVSHPQKTYRIILSELQKYL